MGVLERSVANEKNTKERKTIIIKLSRSKLNCLAQGKPETNRNLTLVPLSTPPSRASLSLAYLLSFLSFFVTTSFLSVCRTLPSLVSRTTLLRTLRIVPVFPTRRTMAATNDKVDLQQQIKDKPLVLENVCNSLQYDDHAWTSLSRSFDPA